MHVFRHVRYPCVKPRAFGSLLKEAGEAWVGDNATRLSAALAYYAIFSLAPLIVIAVSIAGLVFGEEAARGQLSGQIRSLAGETAGNAIQALAKGAAHRSAGIFAAIAGIIALLFGASGVFGELKRSLNDVWGVVAQPGGSLMAALRDRFLSFAMVLGIGFLLVVSLVVSVGVAAVTAYLRSALPLPPGVFAAGDLVISLGVVTLLFAMIFKILPDVSIRWRDVAIGAIGTALLFTIGKFLIGLYLGASSVASSYGAAGSVIVALLWVYYSACILFFGAEFTKVYARRCGSGIVPTRNAIWIKDIPKEQPPEGDSGLGKAA